MRSPLFPRLQFREFLRRETSALRSPFGLLLLAAALTLSWMLQHYAAVADLANQFNAKWLLINGFSFYWLARIPGKAGTLARIYIALLAALNLTSILYYGSRLTYGVIESGLDTNVSELKGLLVTIGVTPFALFLAALALQIICTRRVPATDGLGKLILLLSLLIIPLKLAVLSLTHSQDTRFVRWQRFPVPMTRFYVQDMVTIADLVSVGLMQIDRYQVSRAFRRIRTLPSGISLEPAAPGQDSRPRKIVLMIGESAAKSHYRAYGYRYGRDGYLERAASDSQHSLLVRDAVSPAALTREALPRILSFASPRDDAPFTDNLNLIELAKQAGYQTAWISNQQPVSGSFDTPIALVASTADFTRYRKHEAFGEYRGGHDIDLLELLDQFYRHDDSRQFIVMHLIGSHQDYADRSEPEDYAAVADSPPEFRAYDASVHHTERVIEAVAARLDQDPDTVLIYVPDHGELVNKGHGWLEFIREQYEIPMVVHGSPAAVASLGRGIAKFSIAGTATFNTTNLIYAISEGLGYSIDDERTRKAVENAAFFFNSDNHYYPVAQLH